MAFYPVHKEFQDIPRRMPKGNFGLWFNKFIPLNNENACEPSDDKSDKNRNVDYYSETYASMKRSNASADMLKCKHKDMDDYCASFPSERYERIVICATLTTPLITGIGESHPHEVSMVFDHNMGVPYIPASGIKGVVRFAHTLSLWKEGIPNELIQTDKKTNHEYFDDDNYMPVYSIFGNQKNSGRVVFLDAYPENVPDLHVDIMNPHYGPYYSEGLPPADHHKPVPIKFLTVAKGTSFIFRAVAEKKENLPEKVRTAYIRALTEEGVGAKTAIGYGRFEMTSIDEKERQPSSTAIERAISTPLAKWRERLKQVKPQDAGGIGSLIDSAMKEFKSEEEKRDFARAVNEHMGKTFKKSKAEIKLKTFLQ